MRKPVKAFLAKTTVITLFLLLPTPAAVADVIVLKNGRKIQGQVLSKGRAGYVIEVPYGRMTIPERQVQEIIEEDESDHLRKTGERLLRHDDVEALELLRRAFQLNPDSGACRTALVRGLVRAATNAIVAHRWQRAEQLMLECGELAADDPTLVELRRRVEAVRERRDALVVTAEESYLSEDVVGAYQAYGELIELFPKDRDRWRRRFAEAAVLLGHSHLEDEEFSKALDYYRQALVHEPDLIGAVRSPFVYAQVRSVQPLMEEQRHEEALELLLATQNLVPEEPAVLYHLGLCYEALGEPSNAARIYRLLTGPEGRVIDGEAHVADLRRAAEESLVGKRSAETAPAAGTELEVRTSANFAVHHTDPRLAREAERLLEHHWRRLKSTWFRGRPMPRLSEPIDIYLHADRGTFLSESSAPAWANGITRSDHRLGAILGQEIHFNAGSPQFLSAELPHEVAHLLIPYRIGGGPEIPKWIEEGLATTAEPKYKIDYYDRVVREAIGDGVEFPIAELVASKRYPREVRVSVFYAQSSSLVRFLQKRLGVARTFTLLDAAVKTSFDEALVADNRFSGSGEVQRAWKKWAMEQR